MKGSGYLHVGCATEFLKGSKEGLVAKLKKRSELSDADADEVARLVG